MYLKLTEINGIGMWDALMMNISARVTAPYYYLTIGLYEKNCSKVSKAQRLENLFSKLAESYSEP